METRSVKEECHHDQKEEMPMTKALSIVGYLLGVTVLLIGFALPPQAHGRALAPKGQQVTANTFTEALIADLAAGGFQVSQGYPRLYTQRDCVDHTYPTLKNCFQANPAAPYVVPVLKLWPDEYADPALKDAFVVTGYGETVTYRLDPREAIVIYGRMPPPGKYMGLQTWVFSEHGKWKTKDYNQWANTSDLAIPIQYLFDTVPPDDTKSQRLISLSSIGDVNNNVVMQGQLGGQNPFGKILYFIITPSESTDNAIRRALYEQGAQYNEIFTEQIPSSDDLGPIGPLGMGKNAIDFFTAFRYAVPDDKEAADEWRKKLEFNLTVLRVRAPASVGPVKRYGSMTVEPRTVNTDETNPANGLASNLKNLVAAVCGILGNFTNTDCVEPPPESSFMPDLVRDYGWTGPYCRDIGMDCQGDQQEAAYFFSSPRPTGSGQVYAVVGTLATETGNATYVGLSANDASIMGGVPNATILDTDLKGSAEGYTDTLDNASKFFVHYFTTDCSILGSVLENVPGGMKNCTEISGMSTDGDPALQGMIMISLRDYIAPGTQRGPDSSQLLTPRILTFTPK
jgi:hypothetical protein